jgi:methylated-DNA-[protein]-cysteine S-methyltransferase
VRIATPLGPLRIEGTDAAVTAVAWEDGPANEPDAAPVPAAVARAAEQLAEYFAGSRHDFDVAVDLRRVSGFQRQVLDLTAAIPYGRTRAYGELAADLGDRSVVRVVGGALKHNPIAVIVPCHRVVAADGALTGYGGGPTTGGRLDVKKALLEIEQGALQQSLF